MRITQEKRKVAKKARTHSPLTSRVSATFRWPQLLAMIVAVVAIGQITIQVFAASPAAYNQLTDYVDPFIGTNASPLSTYGIGFDTGDVFPGAVAPSGMLAWSPDTSPTKLPGGYNYPDSTIKGFSLTHFSGRGCNYAEDVPIMPVPQAVSASPTTQAYTSSFSHANESARPGYYQVKLDSGITTKLATTTRTGIGQFTFPAEASSSFIINSGGSVNGASAATATIDAASQQVTGSVTTTVGCGTGKYTLYYVTQFSRPLQSYGTWTGSTLQPGGTTGSDAQTGAYVSFDTSSDQAVTVKTAISYVSVANAQANLAAEQTGWDFAGVAAATNTAWNTILGRIQVGGGTDSDRKVFYTAIYHSFIDPSVFSDVNGQYIGFDNQVHTTAAGRTFYSNIPLWDQYRTNVPLRALLMPAETSDIIQSLIDDAHQGGGGLPRWVQANRNSAGMIADSPDPYIASAYAWGARNFDTAEALKLMDAGASKTGVTSDGHVVRENLSDWLSKHYVPNNVSLTLEYAIDDWSISQFAGLLGNTTMASTYKTRSQYWHNTFNTKTLYAEPRSSTGTYPTTYDHAKRQDPFAEGNSAQYTLMVPFDYTGLAKALGGSSTVKTRLDNFFTSLDAGPNSAHEWIGNEHSLWSPYLYSYAGAMASTQKTVRNIELTTFSTAPGGLPGNDDAGATSSWYIFSAMGLFPKTPGQAGFSLASPLFTDVVVTPESGAGFHVTAPTASDSTPVLPNVTVDGTAFTGNWITMDQLAGKTINWSN